MTPPDPAPEINARLERLEESVLYAERTAEQLSESMTDLSGRLEAVAKRLARLEDRLGQVEVRTSKPPEPGGQTPDDDDPP